MSRTLVSLLLVIPLLSGCGGGSGDDTPRLDAGKAEGAISEGVKEQLDVDLRIECPDDVELKKDLSFECSGRGGDSEKIVIGARQIDDDGNITWNADVMQTGQIEESVSAEIRQTRDLIVTLDCPDAVVLEVDHEFDCDVATPDGQEDIIAVTITDDDGNVAWEVPERPSDGMADAGGVGAAGEANAG